jgi:toxin YoeB
MEVDFTKEALKDLKYFKKRNDRTIQNRITQLIQAILENPYKGIGNPEVLKYGLTGFYSRRIDSEHRLVYEINEKREQIIIISLRNHY